MNFKTHFKEYLDEIRPDLSLQSKKLYANQLDLILEDNNLYVFDMFKFSKRLVNKAQRDKSLDFITMTGSDQTKNQRLSAVKSILVANEKLLKPNQYNKLISLMAIKGEELRSNISEKAGLNIKSDVEKDAMKITWDELGTFAKEWKPPLSQDTKHGLRNYLILNLILNNYIEYASEDPNAANDTGKFRIYVLLRVIEYSSLLLWNRKRPPPPNKKNYLFINDNSLYIQHSKTTGGIRRVGSIVGKQKKFAKYPLSPTLATFIKTYIKNLKIKHEEPIFRAEKTNKMIDFNYFSRLLKSLLSPLNPNLNSTLLRKIYENREIKDVLNANQKKELNKAVDHSMEISETFYKKL